MPSPRRRPLPRLIAASLPLLLVLAAAPALAGAVIEAGDARSAELHRTALVPELQPRQRILRVLPPDAASPVGTIVFGEDDGLTPFPMLRGPR